MKMMKDGITYNQRDIILIPFPYSDLTGSKHRPALIVSNEKLNKTEDRICCLISSHIHKDDLILSNNHFHKGNLPFRSAVRPHRIFTIHEKVIKKRLCSITKEFHELILKKFNEYLE